MGNRQKNVATKHIATLLSEKKRQRKKYVCIQSQWTSEADRDRETILKKKRICQAIFYQTFSFSNVKIE